MSGLERCPLILLTSLCRWDNRQSVGEVSSFQRMFCALLRVAGTTDDVQVGELSSFLRSFCTLLYVAGTTYDALNREVSLFRGSLSREGLL